MALSPQPRVVDGPGIRRVGTLNRNPVGFFSCTLTEGVGVEELLFPAPGIRFASPGFGMASFLVESGGDPTWTAPFFVQLSSQEVVVPVDRATLVAVALIPANGCQMDVETGLTL